jgi:hypothetical protein
MVNTEKINLLPPTAHTFAYAFFAGSKAFDYTVCCNCLNLNSLPVGGFYYSDKVVSTALFRIFGRHLAEVPIVATSLAHQGQVISFYCPFEL